MSSVTLSGHELDTNLSVENKAAVGQNQIQTSDNLVNSKIDSQSKNGELSKNRQSAQEVSVLADKQANSKLQSEDSLKALSESIAKSLQTVSENSNLLTSLQERRLEFSSSEELGQVVVKVYDKENNEVIRQIPSEEFIRVAKKINELASELNSDQGLLFESKV